MKPKWRIGWLGLAGLLTMAQAEDPLVTAGREVYIAEGCMHCHSQFIRPGTPDEIRWGPARPLSESLAGAPPLPGNRRQGPDLLNVGNRRWPEWNRLHLTIPREVSPGSRMPSYAHLFEGDGAKGEALLAYLASLGEDTHAERAATIAAWQPPATIKPVSPGAQKKLFRQLCASCHGDSAQGNGPLAARLSRPPRNLVKDRWQFFNAPPGSAEERLALARIVKFGLPGTTMAGHEYLEDEAVLGLVQYLQSLRTAPPSP